MSGARSTSLWLDQLSEQPAPPRPPLQGCEHAEVAIIGAGLGGLWTAYYLKRMPPRLRVVILEAESAGWGAAGRNGGWLLGNLLGEERLLAGLKPERRRAAYALLQQIPDEVAQVLEREAIACDYRKGGVLYCAARYPEQAARLRHWLAERYREGLSEADYRWLDAPELAQQLRIDGALGAVYSPHCATLQPAKLVRGLALAVERLGVRLFEGSRVIDWQPGLLHTAGGVVYCDWVVPAVEGLACDLPRIAGGRLSRYQLPVQSLLVASAPLSREQWARIGLERGQAFSDFSRQVTYGQRSADDRLVFGARGGYRFGGRPRRDFSLNQGELALRRRLIGELFGELRDLQISHAWGGNLAMPRAFRPHMLLDEENRIALAGGYGGEGVGASNLGGRTLAELILGHRGPLIEQPWVLGRQRLADLRRWESEPWRWLGYRALVASFGLEDRILADPKSPLWRRRLVARLAGALEGLMN